MVTSVRQRCGRAVPVPVYTTLVVCLVLMSKFLTFFGIIAAQSSVCGQANRLYCLKAVICITRRHAICTAPSKGLAADAGACSADRPFSRSLLANSTSPSTLSPANTSITDLTATQAIAMLCSRNMTAVQYVQALFGHYDAGGFECLNAFISLNRTQVGSSEAFILC